MLWTVMLEKTLESPLDCKEIKPVNPKGNQSWIFIGRTDAEAEVLILWAPDVKNQLIGKDPEAGKEWGQEEKGTTEEMIGWHHWLNGHEFSMLRELVMDMEAWCASTNRTWLSDWTELRYMGPICHLTAVLLSATSKTSRKTIELDTNPTKLRDIIKWL